MLSIFAQSVVESSSLHYGGSPFTPHFGVDKTDPDQPLGIKDPLARFATFEVFALHAAPYYVYYGST